MKYLIEKNKNSDHINRMICIDRIVQINMRFYDSLMISYFGEDLTVDLPISIRQFYNLIVNTKQVLETQHFYYSVVEM